MLAYILSGFMIGIAGSFHCIGMCGPLAVAMPWYAGEGYWWKVVRYHLGRTLTYMCLGLCFGIIGNAFYIAGYQQALSVALGAIILLSILPKVFHFNLSRLKVARFNKLNQIVLNLFKRDAILKKPMLFGIVNGLLPCGLIYLAVVLAISTGSIWKSGVIMASFGLGTMPLFTAFLLGLNRVSLSFRHKINNFFPYLVLLTSILLILRGMNLGIPYVSPYLNVEGTTPAIIECK
ncbi:MAG: sulfite exporter TauE/SafE family protein [Saprospiraceae bacterium]|nr:sulfite exporter TauE/SafE family protein [Saprospiraceae bacterium]